MELWLWVINGIMWLIAAILVGIGSRKLLKGLRWLRRAEKLLIGDWFDKSVNDFLDMKSRLLDMVKELQDVEKELPEEEQDLKQGTKQKRNELWESLDKVDDNLKKIDEDREFWRNWGNVREITGSKDIALAAALFAGASVVVGISGVLIALFMA